MEFSFRGRRGVTNFEQVSCRARTTRDSDLAQSLFEVDLGVE